MNSKKDAMYYAVGILNGFVECEKEYRHVKLGEVLNDKYSKYELGTSMLEKHREIVLFRTVGEKDKIRVIEITDEFEIDQIVGLLLAALSYDMKNER